MDALNDVQIKLEQAKKDVQKTVLNFSLAYRDLIIIFTFSSLDIEVPIHSQQISTIDGMGWDKQFAEFGAQFISTSNFSPKIPRVTCHKCHEPGHVCKDCQQYKCCFCNHYKPRHSLYQCPYNQNGPVYTGSPDDESYDDNNGLYGNENSSFEVNNWYFNS